MFGNQQHAWWDLMPELPVSWWHFFNTDVDLLWWKQQSRGRGVTLRQARQEVDSKVRGPKVQEGKVPAPLSSSSVASCLLVGGLKKKNNDEWIKIKKRMEVFLSLIRSIQMQMSLKHEGLRCSQGMMIRIPPVMMDGSTFQWENFACCRNWR